MLKNKLTKIVVLFATLATQGCAPLRTEQTTRTISIYQSKNGEPHLQSKPESIEVLELYRTKTVNLGVAFSYEIQPGIFHFHGKNSDGVFYGAPKESIEIEGLKGKFENEMGLFIPEVESNNAELVIFLENNKTVNYPAPNIKIKKKLPEYHFRQISEYKNISEPSPVTQELNIPKVGVATTIEVGDSLISKKRIGTSTTLNVASPYRVDLINFGEKFFVGIKKSRLRRIGYDDSGSFYRLAPLVGEAPISQNATNKNNLIPAISINDVPAEGYESGIYIPNSEKLDPEVFFEKSDSKKVVAYKIPGITINKQTIEIVGDDSFTRDLVYAGISKGVISIVYKEYKDSIARPAFTQELKYDLSEGKIFGFKGARFEVIKASNTELTYKALRHLN